MNNNEEKTKIVKKIKIKKRRMRMKKEDERFFNDFQWNLITVIFGSILIISLILFIIKIFYRIFK
jgi:hypothetical protein